MVLVSTVAMEAPVISYNLTRPYCMAVYTLDSSKHPNTLAGLNDG
jgi:hypothetical protein